MSEQKQFFIDSISFHFNLRNPKGEKPTPIYMVIRLEGKQYKYPLGCKIIPSQWDKRKERPFISPYLSELDNRNNFIIINKINLMKTLFFDVKSYICNNQTDLTDIKKIIDEKLGNGNIMTRKKENVLIELGNLIEAQRMVNESKKSYLIELRAFSTFVKEVKGKTILAWNEINLSLLCDYEKWLNTRTTKHKITHELVHLEDNTIIGKKQKIYTILTYADKEGLIDMNALSLYKFKNRSKKNHVEENQIYLSDEELNAIRALNLQDSIEIKARDLFCFQCEVGQRFEDINGLSNPTIKEDTIKIYQDKGKKFVFAPLTKAAKDLLEKYNGCLPKISIQKINKILKKILQEAKIDYDVEAVDIRGGNPYHYKAKAWQLVGTHTARRSYISNSLLKGIDSNIISKSTGHSTDSAFKRYNRISSEEAAKSIVKQQKQCQQETTIQTHNAGFSIPTQYVEEKLFEIASLKGNNQKQQHIINQLEQNLKKQKEIADKYKDFADVLTPEEYSDKITELAMDAEMEEVFTEHKRWGE